MKNPIERQIGKSRGEPATQRLHEGQTSAGLIGHLDAKRTFADRPLSLGAFHHGEIRSPEDQAEDRAERGLRNEHRVAVGALHEDRESDAQHETEEEAGYREDQTVHEKGSETTCKSGVDDLGAIEAAGRCRCSHVRRSCRRRRWRRCGIGWVQA
jgi:hypothetical protein